MDARTGTQVLCEGSKHFPLMNHLPSKDAGELGCGDGSVRPGKCKLSEHKDPSSDL